MNMSISQGEHASQLGQLKKLMNCNNVWMKQEQGIKCSMFLQQASPKNYSWNFLPTIIPI